MHRLHPWGALFVLSLLGTACSGGGGPTTGGSDGNAKPVANAGPGRGVDLLELISLDGSASKDPDGSKLSYTWRLTERPAGSAAQLSGHRTAYPSLVPDVHGEYVLELVVNDGDKDSDPATTRVVADHGADHRVGPGRTLATPSACALIAQDGDVITIDAAEYPGDVAVWRAHNLTIHGIGGRAHVSGEGQKSAQGKALWVVQGTNAVIENVEFSGASVSAHNGAGIRAEGVNLTLRNCSFHDNENGVLAGNNSTSSILIERCVFSRNGYGDGRTHNIYINKIERLTVLFSTFEGAKIGHQLKSRAKHTTLMYNRMFDRDEGTASYAIDMPNGGLAVLVGNQIHQGVHSSNPGLVSYGAEGVLHPTNELYFAHNTLVNDRDTGIFVRVWSGGWAKLVNNLMVGAGTPLQGAGTTNGDLQVADAKFADAAGYDFSLTSASPALDRGVAPGFGGGLPLTPAFEIDAAGEPRARVAVGQLDVGACEFDATQ